MSRDKRIVIERLRSYSQLDSERRISLELALVLCVAILLAVALLVFVATGTASAFFSLLWGG